MPLRISCGRLIAIAALVALACALHAFPTSAGAEPTAQAAASGCTVKLPKSGGKLVTVYKQVYKYKFKRTKKGAKSFKRVIVRVKVPLRAKCGANCVVTKVRKGKRQPVFVFKRVTVTLKRGNRLVKKKLRKKSYKFGNCPEKTTSTSLGAPITVRVLDGSVAVLDFGAFQREAPVTGALKGFVPGGIQLGKDQQVTLTKGDLKLKQTPIFIDDDCNGQVSAAIRTGNPATIGLNPTKTSTSQLTAGGTVTSIVYTRIRLPLDLRNDDDGCNKPYVSTGYTEFDQTFFLKGKLGAGGLAKINLVSAPDTIDVTACLTPGKPTSPCNGFQIPLPIMVSTKLVVAIDLKG